MNGTSLDQWGVITPDNEMKKPLILSDEHAMYAYEQSHHRKIEKLTQAWIDEKLDEEKTEHENHKKFIESNYIRIGGN